MRNSAPETIKSADVIEISKLQVLLSFLNDIFIMLNFISWSFPKGKIILATIKEKKY